MNNKIVFKIKLQRNGITQLPQRLFAGRNNLRSVYLNKNSLEEIPDFSKLKDL